MRHCASIGFLLFSAAGCVSEPAFAGPLPVRNQHPAQLTVLHLPPASASVLPAGAVAGRADAAYSNLWLSGQNATTSWHMDGEYLRAAASLRVGVGAGFELGIELPVAHTTGGFLDSFVIAYHDALGLPDQDRNGTPANEFEITARTGGQTAWSVERQDLALLDVPIAATWQATDPTQGLGVALRAGVELPTGDDDRGYGNGELDAAVGILLEQKALGLGWYGHLQHTFAGTPDQTRAVGLRFADVTSAGLAAEVPLSDGLTALVQVEWETSTLRALDLPVVTRDQLILWVGGRMALDTGFDLELGFGEDLQGLVSPDFTVWAGMAWSPRAKVP